MILAYTPISKSFLAPKCVIKVNDPRLQRISVAASGFLLPSPKLEGTLITEPIFEGIPKVTSPLQHTTGVATSSRPTNTEEEDVVKVLDFEDEFEVFNQALSPETSILDLGPSFLPILNEVGRHANLSLVCWT